MGLGQNIGYIESLWQVLANYYNACAHLKTLKIIIAQIISSTSCLGELLQVLVCILNLAYAKRVKII
jgi:hypothetical protein